MHRLFKEAAALRLSLRNADHTCGPSSVPAQFESDGLHITTTHELNAGTHVLFIRCTYMHRRAVLRYKRKPIQSLNVTDSASFTDLKISHKSRLD